MCQRSFFMSLACIENIYTLGTAVDFSRKRLDPQNALICQSQFPSSTIDNKVS